MKREKKVNKGKERKFSFWKAKKSKWEIWKRGKDKMKGKKMKIGRKSNYQ